MWEELKKAGTVLVGTARDVFELVDGRKAAKAAGSAELARLELEKGAQIQAQNNANTIAAMMGNNQRLLMFGGGALLLITAVFVARKA